MDALCLITGATGFVGGHLAESAISRGMRVRSLVRPATDTTWLEALGIEVIRGDLTDADAVRRAAEGVDLIFHCAARVGDWGSVESYREVNVEPLRVLLDAARTARMRRFVLLSSLGVYPARDHFGTDETEPLPDSHVDGYTISKVEAERLALDHHERHFVPMTILRPGFIYGPRDRTLMPRLIDNLRRRRVRWIGSSRKAMNSIYVKNLVEAFFLAVNNPRADGQAYNLTDAEPMTKRRFIETICSGLQLPMPPALPVPFWLAKLAAGWMESRARKRGDAEPPRLTAARLKFMGLNLDFNIEKARKELNYQPLYSFDEGMRETLQWQRRNGEESAHVREAAKPIEENASSRT